MLIYQKHIFKSLFSLFCLTCFTCTGLVWLSQTLKFVYLITKGVSVFSFLLLILLTIPSLLLTIIPISLFLSVIFYYNKIKQDREMIIMENSGLNHIKIAMPSIILSVILTIVCYSISLYLLPFSYGKLKTKLDFLKNSYTTSLIQEHTFNPISKYMTLYVDKKYSNGELGGIIIFDYKESKDPQIMFAKYGQLSTTSTRVVLSLKNGSRQRKNKAGFMDVLKFDDLVIYVQDKVHSESRDTDIQEKYLYELFFPQQENNQLRVNKLRAEGHQRLAWPLFNIALTLIALSIIIPANYNRQASLAPILKSSILSLLITIVNFTVSNAAVKVPMLNTIIYINLLLVSLVAYNRLLEKKSEL